MCFLAMVVLPAVGSRGVGAPSAGLGAGGVVWLVSMAGALLLSTAVSMLLQISLFWPSAARGSRCTAQSADHAARGLIIPLPLFPEWAQSIPARAPLRRLVDLPSRIYTGHITGTAALATLGVQVGWTAGLVLLGRGSCSAASVASSSREADVDSLSLYFRYIALSMRAQMQYRGELVMQTFGRLLVTGLEFVGIWALFSRFGTLQGGWSLAEVAFLYGMADIISPSPSRSPAASTSSARWCAGATSTACSCVRARRCCRSSARRSASRGVGRLAQGIAGRLGSPPRRSRSACPTSRSFCSPSPAASASSSASWYASGVDVLDHRDPRDLVSFTDGGVRGRAVPLSIFGKPLRWFFTFVIPIGCVVYFPAIVILDHPDPLGLRLARRPRPLAGFVFLALSFVFWRVGLRRYGSTGS